MGYMIEHSFCKRAITTPAASLSERGSDTTAVHRTADTGEPPTRHASPKAAPRPLPSPPTAPTSKNTSSTPPSASQLGTAIGQRGLSTGLADGAVLSLNAGTLAHIVDPRIDIPHYSRADVTESIVHFGVGNFHKAHLAVYMHNLMNRGQCLDWGIGGVGLTPASPAKRDAMRAQDYLYTVVERGAAGITPRIIGAITSYLTSSTDSHAVISKLASPNTRIVSLTLTGSGYFFDEVTGALDASHPDIVSDLQGKETPRTVYGFLAAGLKLRKEAGLPPFSVMSCDNIPGNGDRVRALLVAFIAHNDPDLAAWVEAHDGFPNTMVDRIVPQTTDEDVAFLANTFRIRDACANVTEPFSQFVVEDKFPAGRPNWTDVGVLIVDNAAPYGTMKQRLLNASHSELAYLGLLMNQKFVYEAMRDTTLLAYARTLMAEEMHLIPAVPGIDLPTYCETLIERFANPANEDQILRLCRNGSGKIAKFILASINDHLAEGSDIRLLALTVAAWMRYLTGQDEQGNAFAVVDPKAQELQKLAREGGSNPDLLLQKSGVFSKVLQNTPAFVDAVRDALVGLYTHGARATLAHTLAAVQSSKKAA